MTDQATAAAAATPVPDWAIQLATKAWDAPQTSATPQDPVLCAVFAGILAKLGAAYDAEAAKQLRIRVEFGDIIATHIIAMQAAVIAHSLEGPEAGIRWIMNTLAGPGFLPKPDEGEKFTGAQAWFDAKMAEHEAFRAAHPAPPAGAH